MNLQEIKEKILEEYQNSNMEPWFYPEYEEVKGFNGESEIFLLGLNPSSGQFPSKRDKKLYSLLKKLGLKNIHITDFIKVRAKNKEVPNLLKNKNLLQKNADFLKKEIEILKPKIIITMGYQCQELLNQYFEEQSFLVKRIKHYGFRYQKEEDIFKEIESNLKYIIGLKE